VKNDFPGLCCCEEQFRCPYCFPLSNGRAAKYFPVDFAIRFLVKEAENCAATPDFDVVGVRPQEKHAARNLSGFANSRLQHKASWAR
jgi:hypothetical protein